MLGRGAAIDEVVSGVGWGRGNEVSRDGRDAQNHLSLRPHGIALTAVAGVLPCETHLGRVLGDVH